MGFAMHFVSHARTGLHYRVSYVIDGTLYSRCYSSRAAANRFAGQVGGTVTEI